ncbi:MAG TPA: non-ribosomal peptide synthetase [Terriglobales bacterium]|jgi:amino acid adenylation domain-containing protein|nr:non-ribosomal peptide synthetase [Terriglobales bacterium]
MPSPMWNNGSHPYPQDTLVGQLVSAQSSKTPDALALASATQIFTYRQLDRLSNQFAHHLQSLGVGLETLVGICLERSPEMVVAALAVLKAGAAYVPLDPDYPVERLRFMLADARVPVLISRREISDRIGSGPWQSVEVQRDSNLIAQHPASAPAAVASGRNLAYVIYTSGSTGRPKGVQITHESLLNLIFWHQRAFSITQADRASQLSSVGFDAAIWELWPNLTAGSSVHFPDDSTRVVAELLRDWLVSEKITISFVPTPLAESLISLEWPENTALRTLLTGADTLHHYPPAHLPFVLVNNYGPTECTVVTTSTTVLPKELPDSLPPIGRPIDNFQVYILDEQLHQVPVGTVGELHIGGVGLARGYLNQPELDGQRFIENPFSSVPGERLYRTGDLARCLADGQIGFVGRLDEQIKIRGYRIEPDEIAAVLDQYPGIKSSVVVARETNGDKRLIAYLVTAPEIELTQSTLQDFLKKYLPDYMVPAVFVRVASLPMTASGKIDRLALPVPSTDNVIADQERIPPRTPVEKRVVAILSELLGVRQVNLDDNFFFLGGHSLLGTQLIARARDSFGVELPLRTVFDSSTAGELSAVIERMLREENAESTETTSAAD